VRLPFTPVMYVPLVALHVSLAIRLAGDATGSVTAWRWGGVLNEAVIVAFLAVSVRTAWRARGAGAGHRADTRGRRARPERVVAR
jgi:hypothetical protein